MNRRITQCIAVTLVIVLAFGPCLAWSTPSTERKLIRSSKATKRSSTKPARPLAAPAQESALRPGQSITLLPDGRSLLLGGEDNGESLATASITDVRTGAVLVLGAKLHRARAWHSATMLPDGRVLIVGGVDSRGRVVRSAEIFDPATQTFRQLPESEGAALAHHTATLLTNGSVLLTGGSTGQGASGKALLWDFKTGSFTSLSNRLSAARQKHRAILLHDGNVLIDGGTGEVGQRLNATELYNSASGTFSFSSVSADQADLREPFLATSLPVNGASEVPTDALAALVFSKQLRVETINSDSLTLSGPEGVVKAKVVPAENGKLAFVTPASALLPGVTYTISISGSVDANGQTITAGSVSFTTRGEPESNDEAESGDWFPDEGNLHGNWRSKFKDSQWRALPPLQAEAGETALAGQTLILDGKPLADVTLRIGNRTTKTDNTGRFLLTDIPSGHQVLTIDGGSASRNKRVYGIFRVGVGIEQGKTKALEYTIWMTRLDVARAKKIPSPTTSRTVVTNPRIPGLELILPAGTVIRDTDGQHVTELSITPIPTNQPPFPLPPGIDVPVYFTIQPGGSQIIPPRAQLIYPNFIGSRPGTRIDFWNYDASDKGWYVYGQGTVTADGRQIMPDAGVVLYEFSGAMVGSPSLAALFGPKDGSEDGDPVNLGTGLLVVEKTDLMLPDTMPIRLTRTYRQEDSRSRPFGIGATHPYEIFLVGDTFPYTFQDLILPDGGRIHYDRISPGGGAGDAIYENLTVPGPFYKSRITPGGGGWELRLKDGTLLSFPDGFLATEPRQCALLRVQDRYGNVLNLTRDANKNLTKITTPHNRWIEFTYDTSNRITQATDNIGRTVIYTYDASGRLWKVTDANLGITEYAYDTSHRMLTIKDPRGIVYLTNEYDPASGRVIKQTLADDTPANSTDNPTYLFAYTTDSGGRIVQTDVTDPRGHLRRVTFGTTGYSLTDTSAFGTADQKSVTCERETGTNLITALIDQLGRRSEYDYDSTGNLRSLIEYASTPAAATTTFTYEPAFNQLASVTDPLDHTTTYDYDSGGNLTTITDPLDRETTFTYDSKGQLASIIDPLQQATQFIYDRGDISQIIDPLNRTTSLFTDAVGRLIRVADHTGNRIRYEYDVLNQLKKVVGQGGDVTELSYDANGNVLTLKDARNQTSSFSYDNMDRLLTRTDSLQGLTSTESYEYDLQGNVTRLTDRRGKVTTVDYDGLDRPIFTGFGTTLGPSYENTIDYTYDTYGRITQAVDSVSGTINISFDDLARTASETTPHGTVSFTYDKAGRLTGKSVSGQSAISYGYDDADRLLSISQGLASVNFTYDDADRRTSTTLPNGIVVEYDYDATSRLTALTYKSGATVLGDLTYTYDEGGSRTTMGGTLARTNLPQPLNSATYNAANRVTQRGAATLTYDANGNLTSDGTNTYTWDARNQLVGISGSVSASFQYDPFGRRVGSTINGTTTNYLYDGTNVVQEKIAGTATANLLTGDIDEVFSRTETAGTQSILADGLGSTLALLDTAGATQTDYTYEPFGKTSTSGAASNNPSQYTGRENDSTGLYYYRARYYSPSLQRFISEDPSDFGAGDPNLYAYVSNSPCNFTDPSGNSLVAGCLIGAAISVATDVLSGRKISIPRAVMACAMDVLLGLALRGLGVVLRAAASRIPKVRPRPTPNGPACFVAGTLVKTENGDKPIEDVRAGDMVLSFDPERSDASTVKPQSRIVTQTSVRTVTEVLDIKVGGTTITATPEHPFWVVGAGWTAAGELRRGSALLTKDGVVVHIDSIERREGKFKVYNLEVAGNHTYYVGADGILVHNTYLTRRGGAETIEGLTDQAAKAKANGFPHGVSVKEVKRISGTEKLSKSAHRADVERVFPVERTGRTPGHHTVILPEPITQGVVDEFNRLFPPRNP